MKWHVIPMETNSPALNIALDEVGIEHVRDTGIPLIRFYTWNPGAVVIGYFQNMKDEVDSARCKEKNIDVVRRLSGGGAVYNDKHCYTYSVIAPEHVYPKGITESYKVLCEPLLKTLASFGLQGEFKPINDVLLFNKKISGNAQTRRQGVILHHGTLLYNLDVKTMFSVLKVNGQKLSDKAIEAVEERVTSLLHHKEVGEQEFSDALHRAFTHDKEFSERQWTQKELARAQELIDTKYGTEEWKFQR